MFQEPICKQYGALSGEVIIILTYNGTKKIEKCFGI